MLRETIRQINAIRKEVNAEEEEKGMSGLQMAITIVATFGMSVVLCAMYASTIGHPIF